MLHQKAENLLVGSAPHTTVRPFYISLRAVPDIILGGVGSRHFFCPVGGGEGVLLMCPRGGG